MFGYIQPDSQELKVKELKQYQNIYCSVCNMLKKRYGLLYTFPLNYECVFLYIFLDGLIEEIDTEFKITCPLNPFRRTNYKVNYDLLGYIAFINIYLAQGKLKDDFNDDKSIISLGISNLFNVSENYKQDCKKYSGVINLIDSNLKNLRELEKNEKSDIDECTETMGQLLKDVVSFYLDFYKVKLKNLNDVKNMSFIIGQWLYVVDAFDDYEKDEKKDSFNPFRFEGSFRYKTMGLEMIGLMNWNLNRISDEIEFSKYDGIIRNVFNYGLKQKITEIQLRKENSSKGISGGMSNAKYRLCGKV